MIVTRRLKPVISKVMPLRDAVAALNEVKDRKVLGKIVLIP